MPFSVIFLQKNWPSLWSLSTHATAMAVHNTSLEGDYAFLIIIHIIIADRHGELFWVPGRIPPANRKIGRVMFSGQRLLEATGRIRDTQSSSQGPSQLGIKPPRGYHVVSLSGSSGYLPWSFLIAQFAGTPGRSQCPRLRCNLPVHCSRHCKFRDTTVDIRS
jgi:hypothetical protein